MAPANLDVLTVTVKGDDYRVLPVHSKADRVEITKHVAELNRLNDIMLANDPDDEGLGEAGKQRYREAQLAKQLGMGTLLDWLYNSDTLVESMGVSPYGDGWRIGTARKFEGRVDAVRNGRATH